MPKNIDNILLNTLRERNILTDAQINSVGGELENARQPLPALLMKKGLVKEDQILDILSQKLNIPHIHLKNLSIHKSVIDRIPSKVASYYKFMPIKFENGIVTIAASYPVDTPMQDEIRIHIGYPVEIVLARENDIMESLKTHYGLAADTIHKIMSKSPAGFEVTAQPILESIEDIEKLAEEESVVKLVNQIISEAYKRRATDIHIEPYRGKVRLRYRIDGVLHNAPVPPEFVHFYSAILSRMKIMANLNIIERRLPQDGRAIVKVQDQILDLRISSVPTPYAESLVIRLLPTKMLFSLEKLGLSARDISIFQYLIEKPHGIIFVTGPTGSGKTTTLYTCLSTMNTDKSKIITIEDPIEYEMEGITQIQVMPDVGLDFATALRSILRHDPDVIMVGEVRDLETAEIAIRVALTGHLVFSTLHTNDAASGIIRLIDIGIEPYLIASSVEAFIAQRLLRLNCPHCKMEDTSVTEEMRTQIVNDLELKSSEGFKFYRGKGCRECNATGFLGRQAIYEILLMDDVIKEMILSRVASGEIKKAAVQRGMRTLRQDGWQKVIDGLTTPEEILNLTQKDSEEGDAHADRLTDTIFLPAVPTPPFQKSNMGRRVYSRLGTKVNISYKVLDSKEKSAKRFSAERFSTTEDISAGGLAFTVSESKPVGSLLEMKIDLPDANAPIECLAKIVRVEEVEANKLYALAVCFLDLPSAQRARLNRYVEEELK